MKATLFQYLRPLRPANRTEVDPREHRKGKDTLAMQITDQALLSCDVTTTLRVK